ncbi:hypothetical protein Tco_0013074 [Tanacetum coccineum]
MGDSSVSASFRRDVRDGAERQHWDDLSSILNSVVLSSSKDRWTCDLSGDGEFKVKVIRIFIDDCFSLRRIARRDRLPVESILAVEARVVSSIKFVVGGIWIGTRRFVLSRIGLIGSYPFRLSLPYQVYL